MKIPTTTYLHILSKVDCYIIQFLSRYECLPILNMFIYMYECQFMVPNKISKRDRDLKYFFSARYVDVCFYYNLENLYYEMCGYGTQSASFIIGV